MCRLSHFGLSEQRHCQALPGAYHKSRAARSPPSATGGHMKIDLLRLTAEENVELLADLLPLILNEDAINTIAAWAKEDELVRQELLEALGEAS
jgi:hypothetical protein